jgi:hypothetical protein
MMLGGIATLACRINRAGESDSASAIIMGRSVEAMRRPMCEYR